ncbi:MAG: phosphoenolpyruvate--protein phosphotransferase [Spirochaetaceae bacterium]|jgi:phosphotransferase system enzyme I (PtsI)|nr:phosphoenolpyruvate--protein phosphotransferase [Spirochaetaceae bacterium]
MKELSGTPVSAGIAIGKAFLFTEDQLPEIPRWSLKKVQINNEWERFLAAVKSLTRHYTAKIKHVEGAAKEHAAILKAHLMMLEDVDFQEQLRNQLEKELQNIEWILWSVSHTMVQKLLAAPDAYLRERAVDISDVSRQILNKLLSIQQVSLANLHEDVIVVAHDLMPSQTLNMNKIHVKALVMDAGSATSHTAILARSSDVPAVLGLSTCTKEINSGDMLIVDGNAGKVFVNPDNKVLKEYKSVLVRFEKIYLENFTLRDVPPQTIDGAHFSLKANIELPGEAGKALKYGADGIGLFRSEFLFLTSGGAANEEKQFKAYRTLLQAAGSLPVKIRTCDVGGDKVLPNFFPKDEKNPLLGWRAIRFSLAMPQQFKIQLRAILRAAVYGNAEIIFPLISYVEEYEQACALLEEARSECRANGQQTAEHIRTGVMIEVPSAAVCADILAQKADFLSIGTNDLVQYTLAVDRGNEKVNYIASELQPAVLRLIKTTIDAAHNEGKTASMCGELAGIPRYTPVLAGLGLDEMSMSASSIPKVKRILRSIHLSDCKTLVESMLRCSQSSEIEHLLDEFLASCDKSA